VGANKAGTELKDYYCSRAASGSRMIAVGGANTKTFIARRLDGTLVFGGSHPEKGDDE